jgi:hypothetical protein
LFRAIFWSIWLFAVPKSPFALVGIYPTTVFAAAHYAVWRNTTSLHLIGFAFLWDQMLGFALMMRSIASRKLALLKFLWRRFSPVLRLQSWKADCSGERGGSDSHANEPLTSAG